MMPQIKKEVSRIHKLQKISTITAELRDIEKTLREAKRKANNKKANFMEVFAGLQYIESLTARKKELLEQLISDV